ncbi:hypothetical protein BDR26DRAFT_1008785 [Obelidium mucronatum]|nr:hypothetical protein BDR26DRAFT_1008785 [Obelidium mucronatum]
METLSKRAVNRNEQTALGGLVDIGGHPATAANRIPRFVRVDSALAFFHRNYHRFAAVAQGSQRPPQKSNARAIRAHLARCYAADAADAGADSDGEDHGQAADADSDADAALAAFVPAPEFSAYLADAAAVSQRVLQLRIATLGSMLKRAPQAQAVLIRPVIFRLNQSLTTRFPRDAGGSSSESKQKTHESEWNLVSNSGSKVVGIVAAHNTATSHPYTEDISVLFDLHDISSGQDFGDFINGCLHFVQRYGKIIEAIAVNVNEAHRNVLSQFDILVMPAGIDKAASPATQATDYATNLTEKFFRHRGLAIISNQSQVSPVVRNTAMTGRLSILITENSTLLIQASEHIQNPFNPIFLLSTDLPSLEKLPLYPLATLFAMQKLVPTEKLAISDIGTYREKSMFAPPEYAKPRFDVRKFVGSSKNVLEASVLPLPEISRDNAYY